jgi:hypothetical protein
MIDRRELLETATRMSLRPHVVEKDYVLGWMLAGIGALRRCPTTGCSRAEPA